MNIKLIFKVTVLIVALVMVFLASKYFSSTVFKQELQGAFDIGARFEWCSAHKRKIQWINEKLNQKMQVLAKKIPEQKLTEKYCVVQMESIQGIDLKTAKWEKLAQGIDSGGQIVFLEWDPALHVYRAAGLPFKSSILDRDFAP